MFINSNFSLQMFLTLEKAEAFSNNYPGGIISEVNFSEMEFDQGRNSLFERGLFHFESREEVLSFIIDTFCLIDLQIKQIQEVIELSNLHEQQGCSCHKFKFNKQESRLKQVLNLQLSSLIDRQQCLNKIDLDLSAEELIYELNQKHFIIRFIEFH